MMKKIYFTILTIFLMIGYANSQDTVIDFSDTSYLEAVHAGVESNLNVHPNWGSHNF